MKDQKEIKVVVQEDIMIAITIIKKTNKEGAETKNMAIEKKENQESTTKIEEIMKIEEEEAVLEVDLGEEVKEKDSLEEVAEVHMMIQMFRLGTAGH